MTQPTTFHFTTRTLNALQPPSGDKGKKAQQYSDAKVTDLKLEASKTGRKAFCFRAQRDGRRYYGHIGGYPATSIDEARRIALDMRAMLDRGQDPTAERQRQRVEPTLGEFFHDQYLPYAKTTKRSWKDDLNRFNFRIGPKFGNRKMGSITKREIQEFHAGLKQEVSGSTANRLFVLVSAIYRRAIDWGVVETNPCAGVKQFRENNARTRFLDAQEMAAFLKAADADANQTAAALLKGLLLTGVRKSELKNARWADVSLDRGELRLNQTKNGDSRTVLLSDEAKALLAGLPSRDKSDWLFPGRDGDKPITNIDKSFRRIVARANISDFTIHGLRHTHASWMVMGGCSLFVVSQALGHRSLSMSARYSHLSNDVLRSAGNVVSQAFAQARRAANAESEGEAVPA